MTWGVALEGHEFDLEDWKDCLCAPFDPSVQVVDLPDSSGATTKTYLLSSTEFAPCTEAREVREIAIPLIRKLNALLAVHRGSDTVRLSAVVQQRSDGSYHRFGFAELSATLRGIRLRATGTLSGGKPLPPQPSFVQKALTTKQTDLLAALEHYSRADNWYDLYKAFEAIEDHVGHRSQISTLGVSGRAVSDFGMSAEIARHHKPSGKPKRVLTFAEGRQFVAFLLRACLAQEC